MNSKHKCLECGLVFPDHSRKANHIKWHHRDTRQTIEKIKKVKREQKGHFISEERRCLKCSELFIVRYYSNTKRKPLNKYCSRSCANSRIQTDRSKVKKRIAIKQKWQEGCYDLIQRKKIEDNRIFSSKTERYIVNSIKQLYPSDDWKSGGSLLVKNSRIARDLYSDKLKICFEYDGVWHFKDIHGQLIHKQEVDQKLEEWCTINSYRLIRVDELSYTGIDQVIQLIYEKNDPIIKVGDRYLS